MPSFPPIKELPPVLDSTGWSWNIFHTPLSDFWLGTDLDGNRWLTKLRGSFRAYREIVFARLAQEMGWSCQSSAFLKLDRSSAKTLGVSASEIHAAHWFMEEHQHSACSINCQFRFLIGRSLETVDDFVGSEISHLLDWPRSDFAACLFGANEPSGRLITTSHEFVIIDSELMFSAGPSDLSGTNWWNCPDGKPSLSGRALALEVCHDLYALSMTDFEEALSIPKSVSVPKHRLIAERLHASRKYAADFIASQGRH